MTVASLRQAAGVAPVEQQEDPTRRLFRILDTKREEISRLLPKTIGVDQFIGVAKTAVLNTPDLVLADQRTFFTACMSAAAQGLLPDGKEAVLNVYNTKIKADGRDQWIKKVQFIPMVQGLVKKLYLSKQVTYVDAAAVYERDQFNYERGDNNSLTHKPSLDDDPGKIIAAYAVVKLANGETKREVMPRRDIEKVRAASKSPDGPGWSTWYDQFAIKSVLKRAYKQLPSVPEFEALAQVDNDAISFAQTAAGELGFIASSPVVASTLPAITDDQSQKLQQKVLAPEDVLGDIVKNDQRPMEPAQMPLGAASEPDAGEPSPPASDVEEIDRQAADWEAAIESAGNDEDLSHISRRAAVAMAKAPQKIRDRLIAAATEKHNSFAKKGKK